MRGGPEGEGVDRLYAEWQAAVDSWGPKSPAAKNIEAMMEEVEGGESGGGAGEVNK